MNIITKASVFHDATQQAPAILSMLPTVISVLPLFKLSNWKGHLQLASQIPLTQGLARETSAGASSRNTSTSLIVGSGGDYSIIRSVVLSRLRLAREGRVSNGRARASMGAYMYIPGTTLH